MSVAAPGDPSLASARLRGKRVALGVVIVAAVAIIGASAVQIVPAVFGFGIVPVPAGPPGTSERECAEGVRRLKLALDRAVGAGPAAARPEGTAASENAAAGPQGTAASENAAAGPQGAAGGASFGSRLRPEWDDEGAVFESCRHAREGLDAWAALLRLRAVEEELARQPSSGTTSAEITSDPFRVHLEPLRRDVAAHLPADLP
jgi:hypothetical protein